MHTKLFSSKFKYMYTNLFSKCACFWPWAESSCCLAVSCLVDSRAPAGVAVSLFFPQPVGLLPRIRWCKWFAVVGWGSHRISRCLGDRKPIYVLCVHFCLSLLYFYWQHNLFTNMVAPAKSPSLPECGWCLLYKEYMVLPQLEKSAFFMCIYP